MNLKTKIKNVLTVNNLDDIMKFNCWGTTAYVVGNIDYLRWMSQTQMEKWLEKNSLQLPKNGDEVREGDILILESSSGLVHTAIYMGESEWFHKKGQDFPEITNSMNGMVQTYEQAVQDKIKTSFRRPLTSPHISKII